MIDYLQAQYVWVKVNHIKHGTQVRTHRFNSQESGFYYTFPAVMVNKVGLTYPVDRIMQDYRLSDGRRIAWIEFLATCWPFFALELVK